jgi:hypothetical protein
MKKTVKREKIDETREMLKNLPDKRDAPVGMQNAIYEMRDEIQAALDRGYTMPDIHKYLNDQGFDLKLTTLKTYWQRLKPTKRKESGPQRKTTGQRKSGGNKGGQQNSESNNANASQQTSGTTVQTGQFREDEDDL